MVLRTWINSVLCYSMIDTIGWRNLIWKIYQTAQNVIPNTHMKTAICSFALNVHTSGRWNPKRPKQEKAVVRDANGNELNDGDTITVIKDLKVKGSSSVVKMGTKVKNIKLVEGDHDIDCKIEGFGPMQLKSEFVKKI